MPTRKKLRTVLLPYFFLPAFLSLFAGCGNKESSSAPVAVPVEVTQAIQKDMPVYREFVGQTIAYQDVEIRARVAGYLDTVDYKEGSFVTKGQLLYQIDPKPFQAALEKAQGQLGTAEAHYQKTLNDVNRYRPLAAEGAISKQELDNAETAFAAAKAVVDSAKADVDEATLNLGYTKIEAPLDGLVGVNNVKPGNLVGRGENTLLTTISEIDPMDIQISISESDYLMFARLKAERAAAGEEKPDFPIQLILADGSIHPYPGKLNFIERAVDPTTGTLSIRISFPNPEKILRPGQYGKVRAVSEVKKGAILVPQRAVTEIQGMFRIAVVGPDDKILMKTVTPGTRFDDLWQIDSGLNDGETVVVEGLQKIKDGTLVAPTLFQKPASENNTAVPAESNATPDV